MLLLRKYDSMKCIMRTQSHVAVFLRQEGPSEEEFESKCAALIESQADRKANQYLDIVLASMSHDAFYKLMLIMCRRAEAKIQSSGMQSDKKSLKGTRDE